MTVAPNLERADVGMAWGIKRSFMEYLLRLDDARWEFSGGAALTAGYEVYFPLAEDQPGWPVLSFAGSATVSAHFGALSLALDRPTVRLESGGGLVVGGVQLATVHPDAPVIDGDIAMWQITDVRLSDVAVPLFNGAYAAGERLDPLTVRLPCALMPISHRASATNG